MSVEAGDVVDVILDEVAATVAGADGVDLGVAFLGRGGLVDVDMLEAAYENIHQIDGGMLEHGEEFEEERST